MSGRPRRRRAARDRPRGAPRSSDTGNHGTGNGTSPGSGADPRGRFPGFDAAAQAGHWDSVTAGVVLSRLGKAPDVRFFTPAQQATATALLHRLLDIGEERRVPVVALVDARLAEQQTDGWRYADMPEDGQAWRESLASLDADAAAMCAASFAECTPQDQDKLVQAVQDLGAQQWHGRNAAHVWSLWTRYACTAFYADPTVWTEIGFPGPAYPRGYKNLGVGALEPFEARDIRPGEDPLRGGPPGGDG